MNIKSEIEKYTPCNEQEEKDKLLILSQLEKNENIFLRTCSHAHMTASAWVVNKQRSKVLMAYHNLYNSWAWLGGHADGETDLLKVALKEAKEESGIENVIPVSDKIASLEVLTVDGHIKNGAYVSSHLHLNVTYILEADENEVLVSKPDENSAVAWICLDEIGKKSTEKWFVEKIYPKLVKKSKNY